MSFQHMNLVFSKRILTVCHWFCTGNKTKNSSVFHRKWKNKSLEVSGGKTKVSSTDTLQCLDSHWRLSKGRKQFHIFHMNYFFGTYISIQWSGIYLYHQEILYLFWCWNYTFPIITKFKKCLNHKKAVNATSIQLVAVVLRYTCTDDNCDV